MNKIKETIEESVKDFGNESAFLDYTHNCGYINCPSGKETLEKIKSSQHKLLDTLVEEIEGMQRDGKEKCSCDYELCGCRIVSYDQALSDVIALIKEARE